MQNNRLPNWSTCCIAILSIFLTGQTVSALEETSKAEMAGYLLVPHDRVDESYNAGFSMYVAAWPLLQEYPGRRFQTGLFGTWMFAQNDGPKPQERMYSDIEGGLGWWRDTRFATETPKFIMGGVALNFCAWANGPGAGKGRDWNDPKGKYGVAQLSPWILWPPDGLNLRQGTCGELFGYGYLPLPLISAKSTTDGKDVPTGNNCWTLFLNTRNFKGPVAFFTPNFFSQATVDHPHLAGKFLDARPSRPNRAIQMETQYIPSVISNDSNGETYARIAPTSFPQGADGASVLIHNAAVYSKTALWDKVKTWFEGGAPSDGSIDPREAALYNFPGNGGATWKIYAPSTPKENRRLLDWKSFATPMALDGNSFGYRWNAEMVTNTEHGPLVTLPEYYRLTKEGQHAAKWLPVQPQAIPPETGLAAVRFKRPESKPPEPYVTPENPDGCWKTPGPVAGPFKAYPGDGSVVTYYWYRFADQPALLNADLTDEERENLQKRVEKIHRKWTKNRDYLPPPETGELAHIDPALVVSPPPGLEAGFVPIATRQSAKKPQREKMNQASAAAITAEHSTCPANGKLKIFILSGQSNMVGFGQLSGSPGTMETYVKNKPEDYGHLVDKNGIPIVRDDVWIVNLSDKGKEKTGWLTTGYGANKEHIGPEFAFGFAVGDHYEDPVLLIKSAWGGRSLYHNFLSPGSAEYPAPLKDGDMGFQYAEILRHVEEITGNLKKYYPDYAGQGFEIVGFGWHQGWNDRINQQAVLAYEKNMENFITDVRKDLDVENLPFVIANTGMEGWNIVGGYKARVEKLMDAQLALADPQQYPAFKGNVAGIETRDFWREQAVSPSSQNYHWNRNWETYYLIGKSMGNSMVELACGKPETTSGKSTQQLP